MNNIDNLLNNYFEGATSPEEEKALKNYFRNGDVQAQHEVYKSLFAAFDEEKQITAPQFEIPAAKGSQQRVLSRKLWMIAASAAAITLLVIILFPFKNDTETQSGDNLVFINGKEITNPQKAQQYADKMFRQANEIIRANYQPFEEAKALQTEMDADRIFNDLSQQINYIESGNQ